MPREKLKYRSWNSFEGNLQKLLSAGASKFDITVDSRGNFFDLFSIGQLILLLDSHKIEIDWKFSSNDFRKARMLNVLCILEKSGTVSENKVGKVNFLPSKKGRTYWLALQPIVEIEVNEKLVKKQAVENTIRLSIPMFEECFEVLSNYFEGDSLWAAKAELHRIINIEFKELLSNVFEHSGGSKCWFAIVVRRHTPRPQASRAGLYKDAAAANLGGMDTIEILVLDNGRGLMEGLRSILTYTHVTDRSSSAVWNAEDEEGGSDIKNAHLESIFLKQMMNGNLSLRRGRRSEGLKQVFGELSWSDGLASLRSGKAISRYHPVSAAAFLDHPGQLRLPGLVYSSLHNSNSLRLLNRKTLGMQGDLKLQRPQRLFVSQKVPKAFFGGSPFLKLLRRAEVDAYDISAQIEADSGDNIYSSICVIDLQNGDDIDVHYLDSFLQESARRTVHSNNNLLVQCLVIRGVRRELIYKLRLMTSHAILMGAGTFSLLLDEFDSPHFVGLPRFSSGISNFEDRLVDAYYGFDPTFTRYTKKGEETTAELDYLSRLAKASTNSMLETVGEKGSILFQEIRQSLIDLDEKSIQEAFGKSKLSKPFKLLDGHTITYGFDFRSMFTWQGVLITAFRRLSRSIVEEKIVSICHLKNNGDLISAEIGRQLAIEDVRLIVDSPDDQQTVLGMYREQGNAALVLDILYPSDFENQNSILFKLLNDERSKIRACLVATISSEAESLFHESFGNVRLVSVNTKRSEMDLIRDLNYQLLPLQSSLVYNPELIKSKPRPNKSVIRYSDSELSTDFWQNVKEMGYLSSGPLPSAEDRRDYIVKEQNHLLVANLRVRKQIRSLLHQFVVEKLGQKVKVILHPSHAIGALLAREVSSLLSVSPVILPLRQPVYGGPVTVSEEDLKLIEESLEARKDGSSAKLETLILDDSVVSGSSLIKMLGTASQLNLNVVGIFVVLNRLEAPVSEMIEASVGSFAYLFRLHVGQEMTQFTEFERFRQQLGRLGSTSISTRVSDKCEFLAETIYSGLLPLQDKWSEESLLEFESDISRLRLGLLKQEKSKSVQEYQIFFELILNESVAVLDLQSRLLVTLNFLDTIVFSNIFWMLLKTTILIKPGEMLERLVANTMLLVSSSEKFSSSEFKESPLDKIKNIVAEVENWDSGLAQTLLLILANRDPAWGYEKIGLLLKEVRRGIEQEKKPDRGIITLVSVVTQYLQVNNPGLESSDEAVKLFGECRLLVKVVDPDLVPALLSISVAVIRGFETEAYAIFSKLPVDDIANTADLLETTSDESGPEYEYLFEAPGTRYCLSAILNPSFADALFLFEGVNVKGGSKVNFRARESISMAKNTIPEKVELADLIGEGNYEKLLNGKLIFTKSANLIQQKILNELVDNENDDPLWLYAFKYSPHIGDTSLYFVFVFRGSFHKEVFFESYLITEFLSRKLIGPALVSVLRVINNLATEWALLRSGLYVAHDADKHPDGITDKRIRRREHSKKGTTALLSALTDIFEQPINQLSDVEGYIINLLNQFYDDESFEFTPRLISGHELKFSCSTVALNALLFELLRNAYCYGTDDIFFELRVKRAGPHTEGETRDHSGYLEFTIKNKVGSKPTKKKAGGLRSSQQFVTRIGGNLEVAPPEKGEDGIFVCHLRFPVHIVPNLLIDLVRIG